MSEPLWRWGTFSLPCSGLTFFAAIIIGLVMTYVDGRRKQLPESRLMDFLLLSLVAGMVGGRLLHAALFDPLYYFQQPQRLLYVQDCGFSLWGALASAFVVVSLWAHRGKLVAERYLDAAAPALAFSLACGYAGFHLTGAPMRGPFPWAIIDEGVYRHPDGAYAIVLLMALYLILKVRRSRAAYEGELFFWFLLGCGLINILLDFVRDLPAVWAVFTAGQLFSMGIVAFSIYFIAAGPRVYIFSPYPYLSRAARRQKSGGTAALLFWHLVLTGGLVLFYYWTHRPPTLL